ncbi:hypothetical protein SY88_19485 [Clostridiales bacterium PH28_bin88]|nr:hypothetical protein SY88_19485 [Clostridiales bacterium PH28_bin88]
MLVIFGVVALILGGILLGGAKVFQIGRLPGDIYYQKGNFTFFFPLATSLILSLILTIVLNLFFRR